MNNPFIYIGRYDPPQKMLVLDEDSSRHVVQVLRMQKGQQLTLTDGQGHLLSAEITDDHKRHCTVHITASRDMPPAERKIFVAISLLKNTQRFEWFLEKATEIGVNEIIPIICERTENQKFRAGRFQNILVSAMLQSQQAYLPRLHEPVAFARLFQVDEANHAAQKFIAHCIEDEKRNLADLVNESLPSQIILVGPEGDFTATEVQLAIQNHFDAVSLGDTRLRAETAGVVAASILRIG